MRRGECQKPSLGLTSLVGAEEAVAYGLVDEILANRTPELVGAVAGYRSAERG